MFSYGVRLSEADKKEDLSQLIIYPVRFRNRKEDVL